MCAENIFVDELSIEPCHKSMTMTFQKGLNYLKGQNGSGKTMLLDYVAGIRNAVSYTHLTLPTIA